MDCAPLPSIAKGWSRTNRVGFTLVESLLSVTLFALFLTSTFGAYLYAQESTILTANRSRALLLADEALEAVRNMRDESYANLVSGAHGMTTSTGRWIFSGLSDVSDVFTRQVTITDVDATRKKVAVQVTWPQNIRRNGSVILETQLTNWLRAAADWANAIQFGRANATGDNDGLKIDTAGSYAYLIRSIGGSNNLLIYNIASSTAPVLSSTFSLSGTPADIKVSGNYAYIASSDDAQELQIVNVSSPTLPFLAGVFNAAGKANANGLAISSSTVYLVRDSSSDEELIRVNVSAPATPTLVSAFEVGATVYEAEVVGANIFLASSDDTRELDVISFANPLVPVRAGALNLLGNTDATTIAIMDSVLVLGRGATVSFISIISPAAPTLTGAYSAANSINDLTFGPTGHVFLGTADTNAEFLVLDSSSSTAPVLVDAVSVANNGEVNGIAYNETLDIAVGASISDVEELVIFGPQ